MNQVFDVAGAAGEAWRAQFTEEDKRAFPAALANWLVHAPHAHPFWAHYLCSVVHLRPIPDQRPVALHYPGAGFEILVFAAKFQGEPPAEYAEWGIGALYPANLVYQFHGTSDLAAAALLEQFVIAVCNGQVSPDTDFRRLQLTMLDRWLRALGGTRPGAGAPAPPLSDM